MFLQALTSHSAGASIEQTGPTSIHPVAPETTAHTPALLGAQPNGVEQRSEGLNSCFEFI